MSLHSILEIYLNRTPISIWACIPFILNCGYSIFTHYVSPSLLVLPEWNFQNESYPLPKLKPLKIPSGSQANFITPILSSDSFLKSSSWAEFLKHGAERQLSHLQQTWWQQIRKKWATTPVSGTHTQRFDSLPTPSQPPHLIFKFESLRRINNQHFQKEHTSLHVKEIR